MHYEWNTFALNWNHGGISCDVHFAGHLRSNNSNVWSDKSNIRNAQSGGARGLELRTAAVKDHLFMWCDTEFSYAAGLGLVFSCNWSKVIVKTYIDWFDSCKSMTGVCFWCWLWSLCRFWVWSRAVMSRKASACTTSSRSWAAWASQSSGTDLSCDTSLYWEGFCSGP